MPLVVLIILVPFQMKTDVTTSSYEGFKLSVIKDAPHFLPLFICIYFGEGEERTNEQKGSIAAMVEALGLLPLWWKPYDLK